LVLTDVTLSAPRTHTNSSQLQQWKAYNNIRVICSVSAWIG
jgi:hypothetical protein